jgi:hypothetical protein
LKYGVNSVPPPIPTIAATPPKARLKALRATPPLASDQRDQFRNVGQHQESGEELERTHENEQWL